jgi:TolA-binding protein
VADAVSTMQQELPKSELIDDALAEQIYAEGVMMKDINAAGRTFQRLVSTFPRGNAIDNGYTWMAIVYRCAGRTQDAQKINRDIIRLFPITRHARYARERISNPSAKACKLYSKDESDDSDDNR